MACAHKSDRHTFVSPAMVLSQTPLHNGSSLVFVSCRVGGTTTSFLVTVQQVYTLLQHMIMFPTEYQYTVVNT
jgi:hypothetical protein